MNEYVVAAVSSDIDSIQHDMKEARRLFSHGLLTYNEYCAHIREINRCLSAVAKELDDDVKRG